MVSRRTLCVFSAKILIISISSIVSFAQAQNSSVPPTNSPPPAPSALPRQPSAIAPNPIAQPNFNPPLTPDTVGPTTPSPLNLPTPGATNRPRSTPASTANNATRSSSPFSPRLARAPFILGDSFAPAIQIQSQEFVTGGDEGGSFLVEGESVLIPQSGGGTRAKIAENTATLPMDRLIFNYNHFHNAISDFDGQSNVDRFTLGFEKTCFSGMASVDVRLPLIANNDILTNNFSRNGSEVGNLSISIKGLLTSDRDSALVAGMTIDVPTGQDVSAVLNRDTNPLLFRARNDALHLAPFVGFLFAPNNAMAHQGFLQIDVPTNGNELQFSDASTPLTTTNLIEQTLLYVDYSFSKLLYRATGRNRGGIDVRRVAGLAELHYTTTLEDSDIVQINTPLNDFQVNSFGNRIDVVNLTLGVHTVLDNGSQIRLGTVSPITDENNRFFDFEFQAQLNIPL